MEFSTKDAESILSKAGIKADRGAVKEFAQLMEEITADIVSEADALAKRGKRKVVSSSDIKAAAKEILSS